MQVFQIIIVYVNLLGVVGAVELRAQLWELASHFDLWLKNSAEAISLAVCALPH